MCMKQGKAQSTVTFCRTLSIVGMYLLNIGWHTWLNRGEIVWSDHFDPVQRTVFPAGGIIPFHHIITGSIVVTLPGKRETSIHINYSGDSNRLFFWKDIYYIKGNLEIILIHILLYNEPGNFKLYSAVLCNYFCINYLVTQFEFKCFLLSILLQRTCPTKRYKYPWRWRRSVLVLCNDTGFDLVGAEGSHMW